MNPIPQPPLSPPSILSDRPGAGSSSPLSSGPSSPKFPPNINGGPNPRPPYGRANLPTPPISTGSANGMNGSYGPPGMNGGPPPRVGGPGGGGGPFGGPGPIGPRGSGAPSPPSSVARSSNGTQLSDMRPDKRAAMEKMLRQHFEALRGFLGPAIEEEMRNGRPNRARDKLIRLSPVQFQELSEDVFDELERRRDERKGGPNFLVPDNKLHPKRNQARQKLSTLPFARFRALSSDVYFELVRRFPHFRPRMGSPGGPPSRLGSPGPMRPGSRGQMRPPPRSGSMGGPVMAPGTGPTQKSSQSSTVVPNKSYLVEDDDGDVDSIYNRRDTTQTTRSYAGNDKVIADYQNKVDELNDRIKSLEQDTLDKDEQISKLEGSQRNANAEAEWARLRTSLEDKVADAQALNDSLQSEIDKIKDQHRSREQDLEQQLDLMARKSSDDGEWRVRYNEVQQETNGLKRDNQDLQDALRESEQTSGSVRKELEGFLAELKVLQQSNDQGFEREERLSSQVEMLELDLKVWKNRCAKMKTQLRTAQAGSVMLHQPDVAAGQSFVRSDGLIQHVHLTAFQQAVDELLRSARGADLSLLQDVLKAAVVAVRDICDDVQEGSAPPEASKQRAKVSAMANNTITATKNFAASKGISPVSLLDAAAANLSTSVVDLVAMVKLRPSPDGADLDLDGVPEEDQVADDLDMIIPEPSNKPNKYYSTNGRSSMSESVYSVTTGAAARASERFQTLPNSTYQDPRSSRAPSTNGAVPAPANPVVNGAAGGRLGAAVATGLGGGHRTQLSVASQSSYNSQPPPMGQRPSFGAGPSADSSRQQSYVSGQPAAFNFSTSTNATSFTNDSVAPLASSAPKTPGAPDPVLLALSQKLDDNCGKLTDASNELIGSIRNKRQEPMTVIEQVAKIVYLLGVITSQTSPALESGVGVQETVGKIVDNIENSNKILNGMAAKARKVIEDGKGDSEDWKDSIRQIPTLVFGVGRDVRDLAAKISQLASGGSGDESEDDFR